MILENMKDSFSFEAKTVNPFDFLEEIGNSNRNIDMGGKKKRCELSNCLEWKHKLDVWSILERGKITGYLEKLKGSNPSITDNFSKPRRMEAFL